MAKQEVTKQFPVMAFGCPGGRTGVEDRALVVACCECNSAGWRNF
jgi:hypothetical protein